MPKPQTPPKDLVLFGIAALIHAAKPCTAREAFNLARGFMVEAEHQCPGITKALEDA